MTGPHTEARRWPVRLSGGPVWETTEPVPDEPDVEDDDEEPDDG